MNDRLDAEMLRSVFDALPSLIFVVDEDVRIQEYNAAATEFLSDRRDAILKHRGGEVLHCLHSIDVAEGCGRAPFCKSCVIRNSVAEAFKGDRILRRRTKLDIIRDGHKTELYALITCSPFRYRDRPHVLLVIEDLSIIAELKRMIPICSVCRQVQDEKESWSRIEVYFKKQWDVDFSHGLCPRCYQIEMAKLKRYM
jgi:PAS domain-containing protein